ncbi:hypothetical protein K4K60_010923 [Colletotrichum sp. SAR11_57]|nr:hypothetical protein K4K60_010923 [Colletotrichum sp. SAR11_57]
MRPALFTQYLSLAVLHLTPSTSASQTPLTSTHKPPPIVNIKNGTLAGKHNPFYSQDFFLGIPFAAPPISNLRLCRPVPPHPWPNFTRLADSYGPYCMGNALRVPGIYQPDTAQMSEDCLHLNIVRPASPPPEPKLPVMVWIHGGGFQHGSAVDARYNGSFLVAQSVAMGTPVIFVSVNYRLGLFGMMNAAGVEENLLLHDQRQALNMAVPYSHTFALDGDLVTDTSYNLLRAGNVVKVPLLIGTNRNEATSVVQYAMPGPLNTHEDFAGMVAASNGGKLPPEAMVERWAALYQDEIDAPSAAGLGTVRPDPGPALGAEYGKTVLVSRQYHLAGVHARKAGEHGVQCY